MPTLRRRVVATSLAVLVAAAAAAVPAAAGLGPVVIDEHDSFIPTIADDLSSSPNGTLYYADIGSGRMYLQFSPMNTGTGHIDMGPAQNATVAPEIRANIVALPQAGPDWDSPVTKVKQCAIGTCPTMSTFTVPLNTQYVGHGQDRALVWNESTKTLSAVAWNHSVTTSYVLADAAWTPSAHGDANGIVVSSGSEGWYINRSTGAVTKLVAGGNEVRLTPTYVVSWMMAAGDTGDTIVSRVLRSNPAAAPVVNTLPGQPGIESFAANDTGFAYLVPNGDDEGTKALYTAAYDTTPTLYPRAITSSALSTFESSANFLVNDRLAGIPGLYRVAPGAASGALTGLLPVRPARTHALSVSNGRAAYIDDMTPDMPMFARSVFDGTAGAESTITDWTGGWTVGLSGPYVAFTREGSSTTTQVLYGRLGGPYQTKTFPIHEVGSVGVSGKTVYVSHGSKGRLIDIPTGTVTDLGHSYVSVFGDHAYLVNYDTGAVTRRTVSTGGSVSIKPGISGCSGPCVDEELAQISPWGDGVVYAFESDSGLVAEHWSPSTGRRALPMLTTGGERQWYELKYWGGLLLLSKSDFTIRLYDLRTSIDTVGLQVDTDAERPLGLDGHVAAWRPNVHLKAVVRDLRDFYPGYVAEPRLISASAARGFGPGVRPGTWAPSMLVSQDVDWTLDLRQGGATGTVVHTVSGSSAHGEITVPAWDGTDMNTGLPAPQGTYTWVLTGDAKGGAVTSALKNAAGTASSITGTVYFSRTALGAPTVTAPVRSSDTSAGTTFTVTWSVPAGAPAGTTYQVQRSANGGAFATYATTTVPSLTAGTVAGTTYRFKVRAVDPSGRLGALSAEKATMAPHDDPSGAVAGTWSSVAGASYYRGSQRRASAAGATFAFTATGTQIHLIGTKAANYGKFYVSIDGGAYSAAYDSYSASTQYRQVLYTKTGLSSGSHSIKVKVAGTSGRPYVGIDGVAYLR